MKINGVYNSKAPSLTLLRFLRAQNDGRPFLSYSPTLQHCLQHSAKRTINGSSSRSMTVPAAPLALLESSLLPIQSLISRNAVTTTQNTFTPLGTPPGTRSLDATCQYIPRRWKHDNAPLNEQGDKKSWKRWWAWKKKSNGYEQRSNNAGLSPFLDDDATLGKRMRSANDLRMRCTELDENGSITLVNGEFKKSELIAKYDLLPRDLRKIDSSLLPTILIRPSAILVNLLHLRVLIKHDRVLVFDAYGTTDSYIQSLFLSDLEEKLRTPETRTPGSSTVGAALPYEFRALEAILISVTSGLEGEFEGVRDPVVRVLRELEEDIDRDKLRQLLIYSKKLSSFEQKARLVRDAIDDLLEADDDLAAMYLSEKVGGKERELNDHTEVEMLLENYYQVADEIVQVSGNLVSNIRNTEEIVKAILDANRNVLMLLDLKFTILTFGAGSATFFAALYGMNLKNFWEESDFAFAGVSVFSAIFGIIVCRWGLRKLSKVQKVSMWSQTAEDAQKGRRGWAILGEKQSDNMMNMAKRERLRGVREGQVISSTQQNGPYPGSHRLKDDHEVSPYQHATKSRQS